MRHPCYPYEEPSNYYPGKNVEFKYGFYLSITPIIDDRINFQESNLIPKFSYNEIITSILHTNDPYSRMIGSDMSDFNKWSPSDWIVMELKEQAPKLYNLGIYGFTFHGKILLNTDNEEEAEKILHNNEKIINYLILRFFHNTKTPVMQLLKYQYFPKTKAVARPAELNAPYKTDTREFLFDFDIRNRVYSTYKFRVLPQLKKLLEEIENFILNSSIIGEFDIRGGILSSACIIFYRGAYKSTIITLGSYLELTIRQYYEYACNQEWISWRDYRSIKPLYKYLYDNELISDELFHSIDVVRHIRNKLVHYSNEVSNNTQLKQIVEDPVRMKKIALDILNMCIHLYFFEKNPAVFSNPSDFNQKSTGGWGDTQGPIIIYHQLVIDPNGSDTDYNLTLPGFGVRK